MEEKSKTQVARGGTVTAVDHQILKPSKSVDEEAVMARVYQEDDLKVMNLRRRVGIFQSLFRRVGARENSDEDQLPGFGSREVVDHVLVVGFIR